MKQNDIVGKIVNALGNCNGADFPSAAQNLLAAMGYNRGPSVSIAERPQEFVKQFPNPNAPPPPSGDSNRAVSA